MKLVSEPRVRMNPSRHVLPHQASADRRRARQATLRLRREAYIFEREGEHPEPGFRALPPYCRSLPSREQFPPSKQTRLTLDKMRVTIRDGFERTIAPMGPPSHRTYARVVRLLGGAPDAAGTWQDDAEFARQRLNGVNPMRMRAVGELSPPLAAAADHVLKETEQRVTTTELTRDGRLFETKYLELSHERIQKRVSPGRVLAAPHCLFWTDRVGQLMPLAIQLLPGGRVFTPLSPKWTWLAARAHAQAADGCVHEGFYHLLETHLLNEALAMCLHRQVHSDHPLHQLLAPHYEETLAINSVARGNLLTQDGPIATSVAAGVDGTMEAARANYQYFDFQRRGLREDLTERGLMEVPGFYYRDDALALSDTLSDLIESVLSIWYRSDQDVVLDDELQAFCEEAASPRGAAVPGFPQQLENRASLFSLVEKLIFRAGPQHAAVNSGQFDTYGWVPNAPGALSGPLPADPQEPMDELGFWNVMPTHAEALAQTGMAWVLSQSTRRSLLHLGGAEIFHTRLGLDAPQAIDVFRNQILEISSRIRLRNRSLPTPYPYLDPFNISCSTDI